MAEGAMPTVSRLVAEGSSGILKSYEPTFSPIVWTTMATGVPPERHGVTSFYSTQAQLRAKRVWEVLDEAGRSVGVFRWWVTWPPRPVRGFLIPDILARDDAAQPPEYGFVNRLRIDYKTGKGLPIGQVVEGGVQFLRSGLRFATARDVALDLAAALVQGGRPRSHAAGRRAEIRLNADVFAELMRSHQPEFASFYDNGVDVLSHYYWKFHEPRFFPDVEAGEARRFGEIIPRFYELVDEVLGDLLAHVDPSTTVVIVSDHGFRASSQDTRARAFPRGKVILAELGLAPDCYPITLGPRTFV
jgi:hypothetical protein